MFSLAEFGRVTFFTKNVLYPKPCRKSLLASPWSSLMTGQGTQARWGDSMSRHLQRWGSCRKCLYSSVLDSSQTLTLALALGDSSRDRCFPGLEVFPAAEGVRLWKRQPEGNSQTKTACTGSGCSAKKIVNNEWSMYLKFVKCGTELCR